MIGIISKKSAGTTIQDRIATFHGFTPVSSHAFIYTLELNLNLNDFNPAYPKEPKTLGQVIRKARLDRHLQAKELARLLGVDSASIRNWEKCNLTPTLAHIRKLENLLGIKFPADMLFNSRDEIPVTLGRKIRDKRLELRLSQKELAEKLGVTADALADWEADRHKPCGRSLERLRDLLGI